MVRAWNENSAADSVLLICNTAAPAFALIPGCGASAASAARPAGVTPMSPKASSPKAVQAYRNAIMSLPPDIHDISLQQNEIENPDLRARRERSDAVDLGWRRGATALFP